MHTQNVHRLDRGEEPHPHESKRPSIVPRSTAARAGQPFAWDLSETKRLAQRACYYCEGEGTRRTPRLRNHPVCACVLRNIFRVCLTELLRVRWARSNSQSQARLQKGTWGRPWEEYDADFTNVSRGVLTDIEWRLFNLHFIERHSERVCARRLNMLRADPAIHDIEERLGRAFRELQPYPLYPLLEYFSPGKAQPSRLASTEAPSLLASAA
jgi:hypothetical protein